VHRRLEEELAGNGGVISRAALPALGGQIDWALRSGQLVRVLPGVHARPDEASGFAVRTRAVALADPDAIIAGHAAAVLHDWLVADGDPIEVATARLRSRDWLLATRRTVPAWLTRRVGLVRCTSRALTTVDLIPECGPAIVDEALRRRVRLDDLRAALAATPNRPGNALRRSVLDDARDQPWSYAERVAHCALREAGVGGWVANHPVIDSPDGPPLAVLDIAMVALRLGFEIDGAEYHDRPDAFVANRLRDERLAVLGWQMVRFAVRRVLADPPGFANSVRMIAEMRRRQLQL